uniref:Uncharacterized protein n=1 Tax=Compsopogon caeruleus TaxID=31354 RepID=A0A7S1XGQ6_9RHOD
MLGWIGLDCSVLGGFRKSRTSRELRGYVCIVGSGEGGGSGMPVEEKRRRMGSKGWKKMGWKWGVADDAWKDLGDPAEGLGWQWCQVRKENLAEEVVESEMRFRALRYSTDANPESAAGMVLTPGSPAPVDSVSWLMESTSVVPVLRAVLREIQVEDFHLRMSLYPGLAITVYFGKARAQELPGPVVSDTCMSCDLDGLLLDGVRGANATAQLRENDLRLTSRDTLLKEVTGVRVWLDAKARSTFFVVTLSPVASVSKLNRQPVMELFKTRHVHLHSHKAR